MIIHFFETRDTASGVRVPIVGRLRFRATRARVITGTPDEEVLPVPFSVPLDADGKASVVLAQTSATWAWEVTLYGDAGWGPVYVQVGAGASADWPDLVRVDPTTLEPECTGSGGTLVIDGLTITDNLDGTLTIGA